MLEWITVTCPYCLETFETAVDCSAGNNQQYVEDCQICCSPILFTVSIDLDGNLLSVETERENA
jgi:hypothetical protein